MCKFNYKKTILISFLLVILSALLVGASYNWIVGLFFFIFAFFIVFCIVFFLKVL